MKRNTIKTMEEKQKSKIQELHDINGTIYKLIEHLHSLNVPLGLVYQKLRETTTEIQGAITKLLSEEIQESHGNAVKQTIDEQKVILQEMKEGKPKDIIVEYDTKKK